MDHRSLANYIVDKVKKIQDNQDMLYYLDHLTGIDSYSRIFGEEYRLMFKSMEMTKYLYKGNQHKVITTMMYNFLWELFRKQQVIQIDQYCMADLEEELEPHNLFNTINVNSNITTEPIKSLNRITLYQFLYGCAISYVEEVILKYHKFERFYNDKAHEIVIEDLRKKLQDSFLKSRIIKDSVLSDLKDINNIHIYTAHTIQNENYPTYTNNVIGSSNVKYESFIDKALHPYISLSKFPSKMIYNNYKFIQIDDHIEDAFKMYIDEEFAQDIYDKLCNDAHYLSELSIEKIDPLIEMIVDVIIVYVFVPFLVSNNKKLFNMHKNAFIQFDTILQNYAHTLLHMSKNSIDVFFGDSILPKYAPIFAIFNLPKHNTWIGVCVNILSGNALDNADGFAPYLSNKYNMIDMSKGVFTYDDPIKLFQLSNITSVMPDVRASIEGNIKNQFFSDIIQDEESDPFIEIDDVKESLIYSLHKICRPICKKDNSFEYNCSLIRKTIRPEEEEISNIKDLECIRSSTKIIAQKEDTSIDNISIKSMEFNLIFAVIGKESNINLVVQNQIRYAVHGINIYRDGVRFHTRMYKTNANIDPINLKISGDRLPLSYIMDNRKYQIYIPLQDLYKIFDKDKLEYCMYALAENHYNLYKRFNKMFMNCLTPNFYDNMLDDFTTKFVYYYDKECYKYPDFRFLDLVKDRT